MDQLNIYDFLLVIHSNYGTILYVSVIYSDFRQGKFSCPILMPHQGSYCHIIQTPLGLQQLRPHQMLQKSL